MIASPALMDTRLDRFTRAQEEPIAGFAAALAELRAGRKRGHWIWYVFPQLAGLGSSTQSQFYGLDGIDEATDYLKHPILGPRLLEAATAVAGQIRKGVALTTLMGSSIDVMKLVSSLTLFDAAATRLFAREGLDVYGSLAKVADEVLMAAFVEGYPRCQQTIGKLRQ